MKSLTLQQKMSFIILGVFFIYHFIMTFISFKIVELDFQIMKKMVKFMPYMRSITLLGMLLVITLGILIYLDVKKSREKSLQKENDVQYLKSRLFELESGLNTEADRGEK